MLSTAVRMLHSYGAAAAISAGVSSAGAFVFLVVVISAASRRNLLLEQEHPVLFNSLVLSGKLWTYLADLNEQAQERLFLIVEQMTVAEGVTEDLKASDPLAWVGAMNSIRNRAEEIVLHELIYGEVAV